MKTSVLLFLAGIALGVMGMMVFQPTTDSENPSHSSSEGTAAGVPVRLSMLTREAKLRRKSQKRNYDSRDVREILEELITSISTLEDESQLDVMHLIRQASILTKLNESEAIELLQFIAEPPQNDPFGANGTIRPLFSAIVFARLCELNGPEAMSLASEGLVDSEFVAMGMNSWVAADPDGARRWFEGLAKEADSTILREGDMAEPTELPELLENEELRQAYFNGMAKQNPEGLEERINQFETDKVRDVMLTDLRISLVAQETQPEGLLEILHKSTDLDEVRLSAVKKLTELDTEKAANWVESQAPSSARDHEVTLVARELMEENADAGITWYLSQNMHGSDRNDDRMSRIVQQLARQDVSEASQWVESQPDNASRDHAEMSLASTFANQKEWNASMTWLASVTNQEKQAASLDQVLQRGWDKKEGQLKPEVLTAAQAAGFGEQAGNYQPK